MHISCILYSYLSKISSYSCGFRSICTASSSESCTNAKLPPCNTASVSTPIQLLAAMYPPLSLRNSFHTATSMDDTTFPSCTQMAALPKFRVAYSSTRKRRSDALNDGCNPHSPSDTEGDESGREVAPLQLIKCRTQQHGPGCSQRVT